MKKRMFFEVSLLLALGSILPLQAAGDLDPSGAPSPTMRSLEEIYEAVGPIDPNATLPLPQQAKVEGADMIHLLIEGEAQGIFRGSCTEPGLEDSIVTESIAHSIAKSIDPATGMVTGRAQHSPLIVTKRIDRSTPLLYNALTNNENLPLVELRFYRINATGAKELYFTIELINASISSISRGERDQEAISFYYQRIRWTWEDGGITAEDTWIIHVS